MNNFFKRSITGTLYVAAVVGSILLGEKIFAGLCLVFLLACGFEYYTLIGRSRVKPQKYPAMIISGLLFLLWAQAFIIHDPYVISGVAMLPKSTHILILNSGLLLLLVPFIELFRRKEKPLLNIAATLFGIIYLVLPFTLLVVIGASGQAFVSEVFESHLLLGIFLLIWSNDTFAYLVGKQFGRHKLFGKISPKKTIEGLIGGAIVTLGVSYLLNEILKTDLALSNWLAIAIIVIIFGTLGDLIQSMIKRSVGAKDSGTFLPGHGGFWDRLDALIICVPVIYVYLSYF